MAVMQVPVTKSKGGVVEIDTDKLPDEVFAEAMLQGLKVLVNRGTSKITKETYPEAEALQAAAMAKASEQVELIMTSKIKFTGQKASTKVSGAVKTEAMRLARNLIKDEMKAAGIKVSHVKASEITKVAKDLLESMPSLIEQAEASLKARANIDIAPTLNVRSLIHTDPELVAKAEAKKAKDGTLSAKQAGKVKTRAREAQANA